VDEVNIDEIDSIPEEESIRMLAADSVTLVYTNDETVSYTPDSDENTEGFEVEVADDPLEFAILDEDGEDEGSRKSPWLIIVGIIIVIIIVVVIMKSMSGGNTKQTT